MGGRMSQDLRSKPTGIAWASKFAKYDVRSSAAFITGRPSLPNAHWDIEQRVQWLRDVLDHHWDIGQRVQCLRDILDHSGFSQYVSWVEFKSESLAMIESFHSPDYIDSVRVQSRGNETGAYEVALLGVGAVTQLVRDVFDGKLSNGYAVVRPAGHHADRERAGGGCVFANGVFAAMEARRRGAQRILYVDWDAHHGNSQQGAFWKGRDVLTISIHHARKAPPLTSGLDARGEEEGFGFNINIPVPAGSGTSVYKRAFEDVIEVAAERFRPDFVIVSCGLDGNNIDPSSRLSLHSEDYYWMASKLVEIAKHYASGRIIMTHEGGYAIAYIPICFLKIVEAMSGLSAGVEDPFLTRWGMDVAGEANLEAVETLHAAAALAREIPQH
jgi:acetoin utilization deacetylase AcuC-like enzyme